MRRSMTWPWSSTHRGHFWSWGEATTMPLAWKEPWWAPSAQPPPPPAPEWGGDTPGNPQEGGQGIGLGRGGRRSLTQCSSPADMEMQAPSLLQREPWGVRLHQALSGIAHSGASSERLAVIVHVWPRRKLSLQKIHLAQDYIVEVINLKFKLS